MEFDWAVENWNDLLYGRRFQRWDKSRVFLANRGHFGMMRFRVILTFLILLSSCLGQERGGTDPRVALPILNQILAKVNVSGSLAYWGRCDFHKPYPDYPALSYPSTFSGSPVEVWQKAFASDPKMEVTQESNG